MQPPASPYDVSTRRVLAACSALLLAACVGGPTSSAPPNSGNARAGATTGSGPSSIRDAPTPPTTCRAKALPPKLAGHAKRVGRVLVRLDEKGHGDVIAEMNGTEIAHEQFITDFPSLRKVLLQVAQWGTCAIGGDAYTFDENAGEPKLYPPPLAWSLLAVRFGASD